jgi:hypothetical protein
MPSTASARGAGDDLGELAAGGIKEPEHGED